MKMINPIIAVLLVFVMSTNVVSAQEELKVSGELLSNQRVLLEDPNDWAWHENRLTLKLEKKVTGDSRFYSEVWLRNIDLATVSSSADLYSKGTLDPYNLEVREAYVQLYGVLSDNLDMKIGRQRITWGTADLLNPTDNLNPYDLEDILDFGRHRGSDAFSFDYYFNSEFSVQGAYVPFFQPANMPIGMFANALAPAMEMPPGLTLMGLTDQMAMPQSNLSESSTAGIRFKGFAAGFDFSLSYLSGIDGIPVSTYNTFTPVDALGGISIRSQLSFYRNQIIGADLAGSIMGVGVWAEAAAFLPENDIVMTNDLSAMYAMPAGTIIQDSIILKQEAYMKYVVGADYTLSNGAYINVQYLHGFINERGVDALNDYFFVRVEKSFFDAKLKLSPINGGYIVSDWDDIESNHAMIYMPEIVYMATDNAEISLTAGLFDGTGSNAFANFNDYDMMMFKVKYSF